MKIQLSTIKTPFLLFSLLLAFSFTSCEKSGTDDQAEQVLDVNLLKSAGKYSDVIAKRESGSEQTFVIENVKREGEYLKIKVKGGCSADAFKIIWDGSIMLSHPAQVRLVLTHESDNDDCSATNEFTVSVNLAKIIGSQNQSDFIFHIANGSIKEDKSLHPNGSVSSN